MRFGISGAKIISHVGDEANRVAIYGLLYGIEGMSGLLFSGRDLGLFDGCLILNIGEIHSDQML